MKAQYIYELVHFKGNPVIYIYIYISCKYYI